MSLPTPTEAEVVALHNAIFANSGEAIGVSARGIHVMVNPAYVRLFRYPDAASIVGRPVLDLVAPASHERVADYIGRRGEPGLPDHYEIQGLRADGSTFDMEVRVATHTADRGLYTLVLLRDVTEQNAARQALIDSRELYRALFEVNTAVKLLLRPSTGEIVDANEAAARFYGWSVETLRTKRIYEINTFPREVVLRELEAARSGGQRYFEFRHRLASGEVRDVEVYSGPVDVRGETLLLSILHDATTKRALQEQLRQAQKLEAIGRLAGGIAHDFNNLLMVMMGRCELALEGLEPNSRVRSDLEEMSDAMRRARELTRQLLAFARRQVLEPQVFSLDVLIRDLSEILRRTLGPFITLHVDSTPDLPLTLADPGQLDQVLLNLAINARDAMPKGGTLTLRTRAISATEPRAAGVPPGPLVLLEVADTGVGMDEATRLRVFEPFFTTKLPGDGTGLGLATVYGIVTQSGGHVSVRSEPGVGSVFSVFLPVAGASPPPPAVVVTPPRAGAGHILVVDDQEDVREVLRQLLELAHFTVECAEDADGAEARFRDGPERFDALVTDVVMPKRTGIELATALTKIRPGLPVLLISGDVRNHMASPLPARWAFMPKPFTRKTLVDGLSTVLEPVRPPGGPARR